MNVRSMNIQKLVGKWNWIVRVVKCVCSWMGGLYLFQQRQLKLFVYINSKRELKLHKTHLDS